MYVEHPLFKDPVDNDAKLWRYITFSKFISMLDRHELFFSRADRLGDDFEGSFPLKNVKERVKRRTLVLKKQYPDFSDDNIKNLLAHDSDYYRNMRELTLINSWMYSASESAAMWKVYLKSDEGLVIQSSTTRLKQSFNKCPIPIHMGMVNYIDYEKDSFPFADKDLFVPFIYKRCAFEHEKEYRAVIALDSSFNWRKEETPRGKYISLDIDTLIESIYLSPDSPSWYVDVVEGILEKFNIQKEIRVSSLKHEPLF